MTGGYIFLWGACYDYHFNTGPRIDDGQWHQISVIYNGNGALTLYVDYAFIITTTSFNFLGCGNPLFPIVFNTIGDDNRLGSAAYTNFYYNGYLQNIAFYDYAISAAQAGSVNVTE